MVSTELYTAASSTFRVSQGERASLRIIKKYESYPDDVFCRRLPDGWTYSNLAKADRSIPLTFENVSQADAGIYILGNIRGSKRFSASRQRTEGKGAYFHLIVQGKMGILYGD